MYDRRWFFTLSAVGLACSGNASLGNDHRPATADAGASGTLLAGTGGSSGFTASGGSGGSGASTAGRVAMGGSSNGGAATSAGSGGHAADAGSGGSSTSSAGSGDAAGNSSSGGSSGGAGNAAAGEGGVGAPGGAAGAAGSAAGAGGTTLTDCTGLVCGSYEQSVKVISPALGTTQCACVPFPDGMRCEDCTCGAAVCAQFFATCVGFALEGGLGCAQNG